MIRSALLISSLSMLVLAGLPWNASAAANEKGDDNGLSKAVEQIAHEWAHANYEIPDKDKYAALTRLVRKEDAVIHQYPGHAEPLVWKGITLATLASIKGGFGALSLARRAREALIRAAKIDPTALQGSIYTTLGALYFKVPGWPLGFGDDNKAGALLRKGLELNPTGMEANYFYGDYLFHKGRYQDALNVLHKALNAPDRPNRPVTDKGRRRETRRLIAKVKSAMSD